VIPFISISCANTSHDSSLRFVGTNLYWLPTLESNDDIWNMLKNISDTGIKVVRIWAFNGSFILYLPRLAILVS
jgi:mannan endo-1,4-beta-mannosidase